MRWYDGKQRTREAKPGAGGACGYISVFAEELQLLSWIYYFHFHSIYSLKIFLFEDIIVLVSIVTVKAA